MIGGNAVSKYPRVFTSDTVTPVTVSDVGKLATIQLQNGNIEVDTTDKHAINI